MQDQPQIGTSVHQGTGSCYSGKAPPKNTDVLRLLLQMEGSAKLPNCSDQNILPHISSTSSGTWCYNWYFRLFHCKISYGELLFSPHDLQSAVVDPKQRKMSQRRLQYAAAHFEVALSNGLCQKWIRKQNKRPCAKMKEPKEPKELKKTGTVLFPRASPCFKPWNRVLSGLLRQSARPSAGTAETQ